MRLSKLHINGFKSFPDRAELGFDHGVTAIVGPNGCGKSNVVDAITWVLGEQSAKSLRGERMEDVIFNGSDARKPTATAEVRLKLTDVAQAAMAAATAATPPDVVALLDELPLVTRDVEIGRRLYRSGESEYLIDGEVCRLRDIHDLLMDSGLGVKAYAVIEQGKIGQILSSRPAERRALIEEAAGVTKYKARRRSAELKLEAAQQNLTRVDDIIFEVEKQRGALKRQAARARRYRRLREELRRWEQVQFARKYAALTKEIEQADAKLAEIRVKETGAAARVAELEAQLEALRLGLTEAESGATATRDETHARELEYGRRQQQVAFDQQQIASLAEQAEGFQAELGELEARRDPARLATEAQREAARRAGEARDEAAALVRDRDEEYRRAIADVQAAEREADGLRASVLAATTTLAALRQAHDHAAAARDRVAADRERLDLESRELSAEAGRARAAQTQIEEALGQAREQLADAIAAHRLAESALTQQRADRDRLQQAIGGGERELAAVEARLRSLEEMEASRATYGDAARLLLGDTGQSLGHHGAVADHLDVQRPYERAVDALLGDWLQHVVVDRAAHVSQALGLLAERDAGRCGFLMLDEAAAAPLPAVNFALPPGAVLLSSVVHSRGGHGEAISRLLGQAVIVENFEAAVQAARTVPVPVATLAGEVFHGAWRVEAGSRQDARGILETRADVETLRERAQQLAEQLARLAAEASACEAAIVAAEAAVAASVAAHHDHEKTIVGFEADARRAAEDLARLSRRLEIVSTDLQRAVDEHQRAEGRREESLAAIAQHDTHHRDAESRLGDMTSRLQSAREAAESALQGVTEARTAEATLVERLAGLESEAVRLEEAARELDLRMDARRADIARTEERREELRGSIRETERLLDEDVRAIDAFKAKMRALDERVVQLRAEFNAADHQIRTARAALDLVRAELMQSELSRATAASDASHLAASCLESTGATIDDVLTEVERMEDAGELAAPGRRLAAASVVGEDEETEGEAPQAAAEPAIDADAVLTPEEVITDLRAKIDRLGPVNMMAIEQFDELEGRHTFLTTQRKDLLDSISQTGEAIRKIDKTTRERFEEAFHSINAKFETTFTTLFGGGRAGLILIDQENDPESGIDIIAQPPGKRLQNVQLLSGGEKALTAMALMFAVFQHRPSPFCLLDEIDAPLDDANIGRFVEMLQGMQAHTQFILITHNRKTMEIADRLYGVTMEEPGVSKLISVQLN
ncbi:MAG TPA: chromosome segregation protein SMC [Vicinamibacterales bacterium]|nr:chromosome segregation protein SMC [Vicinamibacterales bacterium]